MSSASTRLLRFSRADLEAADIGCANTTAGIHSQLARTKTTKNEANANVRYEAPLQQVAGRNNDGLDAEVRRHRTAESKWGELHAHERCFGGIRA
jgi:hypothetical protein